MNNDKQWLSELKAGDDVYRTRYVTGQGPVRSLAKVKRATKTQVVVGNDQYEQRFRIADGYEVGSGWNKESLEQATPELMREVAEKNKRRKIVNFLESVKWDCLTTDELETINAIVKSRKQESAK